MAAFGGSLATFVDRVMGGKLWCKQWKTSYRDRSGTPWTLTSLIEDKTEGTVTEVWQAPPTSQKRPIDVVEKDDDKEDKGGKKDEDDKPPREKKRARMEPSSQSSCIANALNLEPVKQPCKDDLD